MRAIAKAIKKASGRKHERVVTAATDLLNLGLRRAHFESFLRRVFVAGDGDYFIGHLDELRLADTLLVATSKFTVGSTAPAVEFTILGEGDRVEASGGDLGDELVGHSFDDLGKFGIVGVTVAALTLVIRLAASAPAVEDAIIGKRDGVKVSAVDLNDHSTSVSKS